MTALDLVEQTLGKIRTRIQEDQAAKRMVASGQSAASLEVKMEQDGGDLTGSSYFYWQIHGRGPGKQPPIQNIIDWIRSKAIALVDITEKGLAFLIARKIGREGTNIFQGKSPGLAVPLIIEEETTVLNRNLEEFLTETFQTAIQEGLQAIFGQLTIATKA